MAIFSFFFLRFEAIESWAFFDLKSRDMTSLKRHILRKFQTDFAEILCVCVDFSTSLQLYCNQYTIKDTTTPPLTTRDARILRRPGLDCPFLHRAAADLSRPRSRDHSWRPSTRRARPGQLVPPPTQPNIIQTLTLLPPHKKHPHITLNDRYTK